MRFKQTRFTDDLALPSAARWKKILETRRLNVSPYPSLSSKSLQIVLTAGWIATDFLRSFLVWWGEFFGLIETKPGNIEDCPYYQAMNYIRTSYSHSGPINSGGQDETDDEYEIPSGHPRTSAGLSKEDCPFVQAKTRQEKERK